MMIFFAIAFLWNVIFINYCSVFVIACSCTVWYHSSGEGKGSVTFPILTGLYWCFRYHMGSIAFGSFIILIITLIRIAMAAAVYMLRKVQALSAETRIIVCFLTCMSYYLKYF